MKIINKTYLLVGVLIAVALVNFAVLYNTQTSTANESYAIIRAGDLKAKAETIAGLTISVANGKESDRGALEREINEYDTVLSTLQMGGTIRDQAISPIPVQITDEYNIVSKNWKQ